MRRPSGDRKPVVAAGQPRVLERLGARGIWALNEKRIVELAGLDGLVPRFARLGGMSTELYRAVEEVREALALPRLLS